MLEPGILKIGDCQNQGVQISIRTTGVVVSSSLIDGRIFLRISPPGFWPRNPRQRSLCWNEGLSAPAGSREGEGRQGAGSIILAQAGIFLGL